MFPGPRITLPDITTSGVQQANDLRSVFQGEVQTLPVQAGAQTEPHTTPNFTVISNRNKAICWRSPFGLDNGTCERLKVMKWRWPRS
jgi:hypothetical protein